MTDRDEKYRRNAQRLRAQVVEMGAEIIARGGTVDRYLLADDEKAEAIAKAPYWYRERFREVRDRGRARYADS